MLGSLLEAGAQEQVVVLLGRYPAAQVPPRGPACGGRPAVPLFELFREQGDRQDQFQFGQEADGPCPS